MGWLDFCRGLAVLWMVECHVLNTFLDSLLAQGFVWGRLNFINGLVAPGFLFIAGYLQGFSGERSKNGWRSWMRLLQIIGLGYVLHFPWWQLQTGQLAEAARIGCQVDILQCLAVSLALLRIIQMLFRGPWVFLAGAIFFVGGAHWMHSWEGIPVWLPVVGYFNDSHGSLFPLFPWAGFAFCGALIGRREARSVWTPSWWWAVGSGAFLCGVYGYADSQFDAYGPVFFVQRLGWLLLGGSIVRILPEKCHWQPIRVVGCKSLAFYAIHLILISQLRVLGLDTGDWEWVGVLLAGVLFATAGIIKIAEAVGRKVPSWKNEGLVAN